MKLGNSEFFRWLATNLWSKVQNSKFQIQYGYQNFEKLNKLKNVYETRYEKVFSIAEDEFEVQIIKSLNLKVKIPIPFILITKALGSGFEFQLKKN